MLPWLNCCAMSETRTPLPVASVATPCGETAKSSANSARDSLKPVVELLAMLLAVTLRSEEAAFRPLRARRKVMRFSLHHLANVAECNGSKVRVEGQAVAFRIDADAADAGKQLCGELLVLPGHVGDDLDVIV